MDRNRFICVHFALYLVALLAEGVDRNIFAATEVQTLQKVALLAEGVDRNKAFMDKYNRENKSPSSRRAWIEIHRHPAGGSSRNVALLAEGVDRNLYGIGNNIFSHCVALLAEGVDRNRFR